MKQKLKGRRGETLTEVLVAILVVGASIALLTGMVSASMSINSQVREMDMGDSGFYRGVTAVETHAFDAGTDDAITVKTTGGPSTVTFSDVYSYTPEGSGALTVYGKEG